jgi:structural maintenance of chromosome 2
MKSSIAQLKKDIADAKARQAEEAQVVKRIERDMNDFANNKDGKLAELQASLDKLKKSLSKKSASIKPLQQEMRDALLESEQCGAEITAAEEQLREMDLALVSQKEEIDSLEKEQARVKVLETFFSSFEHSLIYI